MNGTAAPPTAAEVEAKIVGLLAARRDGATICPSEVARVLGSSARPWRDLMPLVRKTAQRMAEAQRLVVTRGGLPVDALSRGGPIRLGRPSGDDQPAAR